jgi:hypothetical protein
MKMKKVEITKYIKISLIMMLGFGLIFDFLMLKKEFGNKYLEKKRDILNYTYDSFINYNVSLLKNDIFDKDILGSDRIYITKLVDKVNTKNNFSLSIDKESKISGNYEVKAFLTAGLPDDQKNRIVWDKEYVLVEKTDLKNDKDININKNSIEINKDISIDILNYLEFIKSINTKYDINYSTLLKINWNINFNAVSKEGKINENIKHIMNIPIDEKQMIINGNFEKSKKDSLKEDYKVIKEGFYIKFVILVILAVILIILIIYILFFTKTNIEIKTVSKKFESIKKLYGERIVSVLKPIELNNLKKIEVVDIEDLVKISDDLNKPMLYNYSKEIKNKSFYILNSDEMYIYKLENIK